MKNNNGKWKIMKNKILKWCKEINEKYNNNNIKWNNNEMIMNKWIK